MRRSATVWMGMGIAVVAACEESPPSSSCDDVSTAICVVDGSPQPPEEPACDLDGSGGSGCAIGSKCAWIEAPGFFSIGCVPLDGTEVGLGAACMVVDGPGYRYDNCAPRLHCDQGRCAEICDLDTLVCTAGGTCTRVPDLFVERGITWAGLCR